ncbi:hypothetical protein JO379_003551 [Streptomyces syringium]|uniref:Uncharacterized protein n=1 Tax=Streptomyces syringium TaxID=76729 RepID=A0ABS4Y6L5_9ACTN|nr:hypothetical protein [Streptomyces syringium]
MSFLKIVNGSGAFDAACAAGTVRTGTADASSTAADKVAA